MKRLIAIIAGGYSSEHDVSMRSAEGIMSFMDKDKYDCFIVSLTREDWVAYYEGETCPINKSDFSFSSRASGKIRPDYAYITIHGTPGEDGVLQGYFEMISMPYSTSSILVEALTFNKFALTNQLRSLGVTVSDSILVRKGTQRPNDFEITQQLGLPCFVKPNAGGSSFGITKVRKAIDLQSAIMKAMRESDEVIIERMVNGVEVTCGCYKSQKGNSAVLPVTEVVTDRDFFDYDAKYNGEVQEITPARISDETTARVQDLTSRIYDMLGCRGIIRIDYILSGEAGREEINLIEVNTTPGMTETSFIPQQVRAAGLNMADVLSDIIEDSF